MIIRQSVPADFEAILAVINDAAQAYRDVIPPDRWHEPYMPAEELANEIVAGVAFWVAERDGRVAGVMGMQDKGDVVLVRHAYVETSAQKTGVGTSLLRHVENLVDKRIRSGPGRRRRGPSISTGATGTSKFTATTKNDCSGNIGRYPADRSKRPSCWAIDDGRRARRNEWPARLQSRDSSREAGGSTVQSSRLNRVAKFYSRRHAPRRRWHLRESTRDARLCPRAQHATMNSQDHPSERRLAP